MNQVTQQNAANSEESASAAEELNSQAAELASMVSEFTLSADNNGIRRSLPPKRHQQRQAIAAIPDKSVKKAAAVKSSKYAKAVKSEEVFSLDDDELSDF